MVINAADIPTNQKDKLQKRDPVDSRKIARVLERGSMMETPGRKDAFSNLIELYEHNRPQIVRMSRVRQKYKLLMLFSPEGRSLCESGICLNLCTGLFY